MIRSRTLRRAWVPALLAAALVGAAALTAPATAAPSPAITNPPLVAGADRPADPVAHDPTVVKEGDWYYLAITGDAATGRDYLPMKRSKDLLSWEALPPVFTQVPDRVLAAIGATQADAPKDAWAPDLSWTGTEWRLYYSVSRFGTTNSVTALATSKTLDPDSPDYGWTDQGVVIESEPGSLAYNAIDANYTQDAQGKAYLTFGSFFGGIQIVALDPATGKLAAGATPQTIATRPIQFNPIEGPSIIRNGDHYYLFVAFDYCCRGAESDYRVMVGRSTSITGPYVDKAGVPMLQGGGTEVLRGYNEFQGTGHPDTFSDGGTDFLVNHYYDLLSDPTPRANIRAITWTGGWPTVGDPANPSRWAGHGSAYVQVVPREGAGVVGTENCGYATANVVLTAPSSSTCQQWQIDARDARQVTDGSETGSRFQNRNANMSADLPGCAEAQTDGDVRQFDWLGNFFYNICQRWTFTPAPDGYTTVASIAGRNLVWTAAGTDLRVGTPTAAASQQFRFQPVGPVLLGSATDRTQTLGQSTCSASKPNSTSPVFQTRTRDSCQEWTVTSTGGAQYAVTNTRTGLQLAAGQCGDEPGTGALRLVKPGPSKSPCRAWTLVPGNDGTWSLTNAGTGVPQQVRLLIP
ncbi:family 43 glycosylhydrolase [Modestobacter sp. I12A-02628]|uniref:Family 43 glycosylhydrolase n=1 Tax=Goekera deserti TaxID=2497753 RepID=A0A7K3WIG0_9ACTN|nr:family 43 glycosylhydrolase [Goekera deserti]MPQ96596.1 family 43 glycosylhydrolase [Goekera deserti]NDI47092.1 family 43 glycosylhydrolase [Goekera deserti]NEL55510.1 family 43 glycosylhydrolase [Goekera deserti]